MRAETVFYHEGKEFTRVPVKILSENEGSFVFPDFTNPGRYSYQVIAYFDNGRITKDPLVGPITKL